jgi:hypothetical protein
MSSYCAASETKARTPQLEVTREDANVDAVLKVPLVFSDVSSCFLR